MTCLQQIEVADAPVAAGLHHGARAGRQRQCPQQSAGGWGRLATRHTRPVFAGGGDQRVLVTPLVGEGFHAHEVDLQCVVAAPPHLAATFAPRLDGTNVVLTSGSEDGPRCGVFWRRHPS